MNEKWIAVNAGAPMFTAKDLAAAEERGRRSGVEERDELRRELWQTQAKVRDLEVCVERFRALAPRDSAPVCDCESALNGGGHLARCAVYHWRAEPRDSGKDLEWPEDGT